MEFFGFRSDKFDLIELSQLPSLALTWSIYRLQVICNVGFNRPHVH